MKTSCTKLLLTIGVGLFLTKGLNAQTYCNSGSTQSTDSDITDVELGSISNNTGNTGCATYTYFNNMSTDLYVGSSYQMSVTLGVHTGGSCGSDVYTKSARAFIDFNQDGDFTDAGENLGTTAYTSGTFTSLINFQVPCSGVAGTTRMRIVCIESNSINPCGTFPYGETEDYNVNIIPGSSPTADFALPDTVYSGWVATFANVNQGGYTHKWYNSDIDPTLQTVVSTSVNYQYSFSTAGTYSLRLESTNCQGTAIKTKNVVVVDPTSTPVANFVSSINVYYYSGNPVEIDLFDLSSFGPSSWEWTITPDVGNGAPWFWSNGNQYSQNPSAFFYDIGTYEVCLTVTNSLGSSAPLCRTAYIIITPPTGSNYTNIMGEDFKSTSDSGEIFDSGGPNGNYSDNEYYEFTIAPCGASSITLTMNALDLENNWDYLRIYDGPDASSPMLAEFTGNTLPSGSIKSSQGSMTLLMTSDGNTFASGFAASWTSEVPQNGAISADIDLPDTLWECSGGTDLVLLNATTGVVPGQATYDWIIDYDPNVTYPVGYCDYCDEENPEWNVTASGQYEEYQIRMVAKSCEGNDTVVKVLRVSPTTNLPDVEFEASNRRVSAGSVVTLTDMSVAGCSYMWDITPVTGWALEPGYSLTDRIIEVKFNSAGSYHVEMEVTNDNGSATETKTNYIDVIDYCTPSVVIPSISDVGITRVKIENIDNETPSGKTPGYFNYTADFGVVLTAGQTYQLLLERPSTVNSMTRKAWIDFNRDGEFQEATERVMLETNANTLSYTATFTVPDYTYTLEGESRLRVGASLGATSFNSCGPIQVGEFEDYGVTLRFDDQPPVITLKGLSSVTLEVNSTYTEDSAQAIDNIEGDISSRIVITNQVDMSQPGIYYVHYDVTDGSGLMATRVTRTVIVSTDITKPVITLIGGSPVVHSVLVPFTDPGYTALDNPGNKNVTGDVVITGNVDVTTIGDYDLTYKVSDINGNSTAVVRTVQVRDIDAPLISSPANVFWQVGTPFINPVSITDNFDPNVQVTVTGSINVNVFGSYTVTFNAVDFSGNAATPVTVVFQVGDAIDPVISTLQGTDQIIVEVNNANFFEPPVTATDNYYPSVSLVRDASALNIYELGCYPVVYTATDGSGNTATYTRTICVVDIEKPVVIAPPMNIQRWSNTFAPLSGLSVLDNYWSPQWFASNPSSIEVVLSNVDVNYPGVYSVVYRVTDGSGNISSLTTRIVNVWTPTSVEGMDLESMIEVYPNPSNGVFTVKLDEQLGSRVSIQIVDALGKGIYAAGSEAFVNGEASIDLSHVTAGVYLIQLTTEQGSVSKRVVIQ
ncbi:MAG: immunoglobulin-like domain-containing protein [Bacteroidia bacterium]